ncbi:hypothetical protein FACS1894169_04750 [Bacteroidia bacterium]|nr:hypothetical protein FACS1894169_04750 [Bacteroidia bacterium]
MRKKQFLKALFILVVIGYTLNVQAQDIDLENIGDQMQQTLKKNPIKLSGGLSASSLFYNSNVNDSRDNFNYFLNGNLNIGIYNWSLPISYSLTNQGANLGYDVPFKFNRLSVSPKYKWMQAHLGDVSMTFSPYTLNGLLITGGGLELTPDVPFKIAMVAGRLNKAIEDNDDPRTIPAYRRMGYGTQMKWEKEGYKVWITGFYAKDAVNSLDASPDIKGVLPQENLVLSVNASVKVYKNIVVYGEYANSLLTNDLRANEKISRGGLAGTFLKGNVSTETFDALNGGINLNLKNMMIGIRYEKVDPNYRTLGAYYFTNDLENITLNTTFNLLQGKVTFAGNIGRQWDNLDDTKLKETSRWVGSANINVKISEKLMLVTSYSNFTMFTNRQLNQFTNINDNPLLVQQPMDSIDYKQISQNVNMNLNYTISNSKELIQNLNMNYSLNDMVNKENGITRKGNISRFHNANVNYAIGFPNQKFSIAASVNYTNSYSGSLTSNIWGPALTLNKAFFKDKLTTTIGASYNSSTGVAKIDVTSLRLGANYTPWNKHNFNASIIQMFRKTDQDIPNPNVDELTASIGYSYSF